MQQDRIIGDESSGLFTTRRLAETMESRSSDSQRRGGRGGSQRGGRGGRMASGRRSGGPRGTSSYLPHTRSNAGGDLDGDLDMGGEKKKNFSPYQRPPRNTRSADIAPSSSASTPSEGKIVVFINGPGVGTDSALIDYLSRKTSPVKLNISNKRSAGNGNTLSFELTSDLQAKAVRALSGFKYKGAKLLIKTTIDDRLTSPAHGIQTTRPLRTSGTIDAIRAFIRSRHNNGFLNLENMAADANLRAASIVPPGAKPGKSEIGAVMMKVASELFPEITTISFASNRLKSLIPISSVAQFFPNLQNLSFQDNSIFSFKDLESLSGPKKLSNLRELILLDNPVRDNDIAKNKDDISYRRQITKMFPSLQVLDQVPVAPKISFGLGDITKVVVPAVTLPLPVKGNFYDSPGTQAMVQEFLATYFDLFDTNRSVLEHMYDDIATFSYSTVSLISPLQKVQGKPGDSWSEYHKASRNMCRVKDLSALTERIHVGNTAIVKQGLMNLPKTKHDLSDASKISVDAWQTGGLLPTVCIYIMVHGEYEQLGTKGLRKSFDRSFIIAPAPATSRAAAHGWKCIIISDQMTLRNYNGYNAWKPEVGLPQQPVSQPGVTPVGPGTPVSNAVPQPQGPGEVAGNFTPEQQTMISELQRLTGLNTAFSIQCLMASNWDIPTGMALVERERANIPQDAWQNPPPQK
ncbi:nuclear mRNA export, poly(A)+RNA binding protein [Haplosporangium sp. Z 767]|nr:nuclear mRNA export, poly(A)+RNA binding protein [Haplosporangium sp. Z 767]KAF9196866.1 nuclear mRNA export, poly(A)+RNA binding protein [Haplosporangium sp. Z 11]